MDRSVRHLREWWDCLLHPERASALILDPRPRADFALFLALLIALLYLVYGLGMGLFRGVYPGAVAGVKLPFLFLFSLMIGYPSFYVIDAAIGLRLGRRAALRLILMGLSVNAIALASYAPINYFFTLTSYRSSYSFLVLMHVAVFAVSAMLSLGEIALIFRATSRGRGRATPVRAVLAWSVVYAGVGAQMSWVLRPWIGTWTIEYAPFRALEGNFAEALWRLIF